MKIKIVYLFLMLLVWQVNLPAQDFYFFKGEKLAQLKSALQHPSAILKADLEMLRKTADHMLTQGPWSVTDYESPAVSGNKHDYFSESPYWWPNPKNPDGPYIRKDGERNPQRFMAHKNALKQMSSAVSVLSLAAWLFDEPKYAKHAILLLRVWFLDEATKMNPHLNYAQAIRNRSDGRGVGIIDTHRFIYMLESLNFLQASGQWPKAERRALQDWFSAYLNWLRTSKNGLHEQHQGNNHTTWWCAQVASIGRFTDQPVVRDSLWQFVVSEPLQMQFEADGRMPKELARTKSLDYCKFNLNAWSLVCTLADLDGKNLWTMQNSKGGSVEKAIDFLVPYLKKPDSWKWKQIIPVNKRPPLMLFFADRALPDKGYGQLFLQSRPTQKDLSGYSGSMIDYVIYLMQLAQGDK